MESGFDNGLARFLVQPIEGNKSRVLDGNHRTTALRDLHTEAEKDPELARKLLVHKIPRKVSFHVVLPGADKTDIFDWAECMFLSIYLSKFLSYFSCK